MALARGHASALAACWSPPIWRGRRTSARPCWRYWPRFCWAVTTILARTLSQAVSTRGADGRQQSGVRRRLRRRRAIRLRLARPLSIGIDRRCLASSAALGQFFLFEALRRAPASAFAPFEYSLARLGGPLGMADFRRSAEPPCAGRRDDHSVQRAVHAAHRGPPPYPGGPRLTGRRRSSVRGILRARPSDYRLRAEGKGSPMAARTGALRPRAGDLFPVIGSPGGQ